ncbi:DegT/DnrJ/EryC1/StrS family aminotransferase [Vibrio breoganii]
MIKFLDLYKQYNSIKNEIDLAIENTIKNSSFIGGKPVKEFESSFLKAIQSKYCIGVGNGTDALEIALEAADLEPNSEVIVPANSFIASSEAVSRLGYKVVFVDIDPNNYTLSIDEVRKAINENTSAIIAVHLYGHPCDMDSLMALAKKFDLVVIEDCAQAHLAEFKGKVVGSIGHFGTFSFYPGKNLGAYGDGGAVTTNSESFAERVRKIANHGRIGKYDHEFEGRNSRLDGLQAAILSCKLKHLSSWTNRRIDIADKYLTSLSDIGEIKLPFREDWAKQVYHLFVIRCESPLKLKEFLLENGIETGVHYPIALPKLPAYKYLNQIENAPLACSLDSTLLSLPIGEHLTEQEVEHVISNIKRYYAKS